MANVTPLFELLLPKRPVSHQTNSRESLQTWKNYIYGRARSQWRDVPHTGAALRLSLVYLCDDSPADVDNIIKPIQDALVGLVFADDALISDVDSHRRFLTDTIDIVRLPSLLRRGVLLGIECVYIRISLAEALEVYL